MDQLFWVEFSAKDAPRMEKTLAKLEASGAQILYSAATEALIRHQEEVPVPGKNSKVSIVGRHLFDSQTGTWSEAVLSEKLAEYGGVIRIWASDKPGFFWFWWEGSLPEAVLCRSMQEGVSLTILIRELANVESSDCLELEAKKEREAFRKLLLDKIKASASDPARMSVFEELYNELS